MALEAVIGQDAAQVRMAREQDAVKVIGLALEPVRRREHADKRGNRGHLVRLTFTRMRVLWCGDSRW